MTRTRIPLRRRWRAGRIVLRRALRRWSIPNRRATLPAPETELSEADALPAVSQAPEELVTGLAERPANPQRAGRPRRQAAWQLAAVTGSVGIILLLLMQISALISSKAAGETRAIAPAEPPLQTGDDAIELAHNEVPLPIPEDGLPPWRPPDYVPDALPEPEPLPDVDLALAVARYTDDAERFAVASAADEPDDIVALVTGSSIAGTAAWDPFDVRRPQAASRVRAIEALLGRDHGDMPPLEPVEPESAPADHTQFDVVIEKYAPATGVVFQPLEYEIVVRNAGRDEIPQIMVDELLPESHRVEHTLPAARISGQSLSWQLRDISPGEVRTLHVRTIPTAAGPADSAAVVEAMAAVMAETRVTVPRVRLEIVAPEHHTAGRLTKFTFRVINEGEVDAADLVLRTDLPELLSHPLGRELDYPIGTLLPGEIREMTLTAVAETPGTANYPTEIHSAGESLARETVSVSVETPGLSLRREGLKQPPIGEAVQFTNHVANTGDRSLTGLEIVETVPEGFEVTSVGEAGEFDRDAGTIRWRLEELPAGRRATFNVTLRATRPGMLRTTVTVRGENHPEQTMHATVAPRTVVPLSRPMGQTYPRSPVASGWPMRSPTLSSWPLGGGFRSGCAP